MIRYALTFALLASPVAAQEVYECDWRAEAQMIAEPWEDNTRSFANGDVRLAILDTIEPASGAFHVLVLAPPYSETGDRTCSVISWDGTMGWMGLSFADIPARYDPATGLTVFLDGRIYVQESGFTNTVLLEVTVNQSTGDVSAYQQLGRE